MMTKTNQIKLILESIIDSDDLFEISYVGINFIYS